MTSNATLPFSELVLASNNKGKLAELQAMLGNSIKVRPQSDFTDIEAEETGLTFVENALIKARHAARASGLPALADDSGLAVDALGGAPGIYSARYAGGAGDAANNAKLLEALRDVPDAERGTVGTCTPVRPSAPRQSKKMGQLLHFLDLRVVCDEGTGVVLDAHCQ